MTYIAIKISNEVSLRRLWSLKEDFTKVTGVVVDIALSEYNDVWTFCDVYIDDGDDVNSIASKRLVDYIEGIPMQEIVLDWDTMFEVACEDCERDDE